MNLLLKANTFPAIYQQTPNYLNLIEADKEFFDGLFVLLLVFGDLTMSNKELSVTLKKETDPKPIPVSTIEKRISRLKKAGLIIGWEDKERIDGSWLTIQRHLQLDPELFSFVKIKSQEERIFTARLKAASEGIDSLIPKVNKPSEPPPTETAYKIEVRFD